MKVETAPIPSEKPGAPGGELAGRALRVDAPSSRIRAALRFDGLWWRKIARLGSIYSPEWFKRGAPPIVALIIFALVRRNRRGAMGNQARVAGVAVTSWKAVLGAYKSFAVFAHCMQETMEYYGPRARAFRIDEPIRNHVAEALAQGRGVILATAHVGNWDISGRALHATGRPVFMVMGREANETTQDYERESREERGMRVIYSDSSVFSAFNMIRALRQNEILAIQIDRGSGGPSSPTRMLPFFGSEAVFQEGAFHLARLSGAPVVPVVTLRRGRRHYEIVLGEPLHVSRETSNDAERALREAVTFFERTIRATPAQWFQFAPFWPARS